MKTNQKIPKKAIDKKPALDSTIAGGSIGTLVLMIAQNLQETTILVDILTYSSPFIGIAAKSVWSWGKQKINNSIKNKQFNEYIEDCKNFIKESIDDPNISEQRKDELKSNYDKLNTLAANVHFDKIKSVQFDYNSESIIDHLNKIKIEETDIKENVS